MRLFDFLRSEKRQTIEDPRVPISDKNLFAFLGLDDLAETGESVTIDAALGVPAIWAAINFLAGTLAGLPLHLYKRDGETRKRVSGGLADILHHAPNAGLSSFDWRKHLFESVFTGGRGVSFIERNRANRIINIWALDPTKVTVKRRSGRVIYQYRESSKRNPVTYESSEVIDIAFMLKSDLLKHRSPIGSNKNTIALTIAVTKYCSRFFQGGGVPPFAIEGPFQSPGAVQRAADDLAAAVKKASKEKRQALAIPSGHKIHELGTNPEKMLLVNLQRFVIEEIARIYSMPPTFLQDLTHGTFSNTEQQDLHFVKHTIKRWVEQFEQELNLKLFGRGQRKRFAEMNIDGLLRGDFKTRMDGYGTAIQNGIFMPNEARRRENLPDDPNGDQLLIQGATIPLGSQPTEQNLENDDGS